MPQPVFLAVDGGGSKGRAVLERGGRTAARMEPSGLNPRDITPSEFEARLASLVSPLFAGAMGTPRARAQIYACVALAGAGDPAVRRRCRVAIGRVLRRHGICRRLRVVTDAAALVETRLGHRDGIVLIAGTGSICLGVKHARGRMRVVRAGGLGGVRDEGCGFAIGARFAGHSLGAVRPERARVASLAPLVFRACAAGDRSARAVIEEAVCDLVRMVVSVRSGAGLSGRVEVHVSGGLFQNDAFRSLFRRRLARALPGSSPQAATEVLPALVKLARKPARPRATRAARPGSR